ncbi:MAG: AbrB/MazE/SpoVT family DNA-binding domain-containing protein [Bacteroidota bacterium]|nr:AbrB/MazE/SpoVT family DNA-binding domain-containing protein [Bacteroidota bacterium]
MIQVIRKIGNSSGILLPKAMLLACGITTEVEIEVQDKTILLRPVQPARQGWEAAFAAAIASGDEPEGDVFEGLGNEFDHTEW